MREVRHGWQLAIASDAVEGARWEEYSKGATGA